MGQVNCSESGVQMYSSDLRTCVTRMYLSGAFRTLRRLAVASGISKSTIHRWVRSSPLIQRRTRVRRATLHVFEGSCKSDMFQEFIRNLPVPEGMTHALIDNCSIHTTIPVLKSFAEKGLAPMFLSPYSPMLQPIETVFSQLKALFRKTKDGDGWPHPQGRGWREVAGESISVRIQTALCMVNEDSLCNAFAACWSEAARLARLDG
jgi:hypothetical protein